MQIDSAVVSVLLGIKSHDEVSSFKSVFGKHEHTKGTLKEGASMSIICLQPTCLPYAAPIVSWRCSPPVMPLVRHSVARRSAEAERLACRVAYPGSAKSGAGAHSTLTTLR